MTSSARGAIAAGHPLTVEAGLEMYRLGGNAFDAAVAAMVASWVTEPGLTSAAGGGFCLAHSHSGETKLFDFFTQTPSRKRPTDEIDFYPVLVEFGGGVVQEFHVGLGAIAVPGCFHGALTLHKRFGSLPLKDIAAPAIDYARKGIEVNAFQGYCFQLLAPILTGTEELRAVYAPRGERLQAGDTQIAQHFADALDYLVTEGIRGFYQGDIANQLIKDCQETGGHLTHADLENYRTIERSPLSTTYRGRQLLTNPPPSFGGTLIAFTLKLLETVPLERWPFGSHEHVVLLAQAMRATNLARSDHFNHAINDPSIAQKFLSQDVLAPYTKLLEQVSKVGANKWGSTTHISTLDNEGNAASITASNGEGAAYAIPGTGISMNNMLGEDDLNPGGFHRWQEGVRMSSMMSPTMILEEGQPTVVLGSGGSKRIRTAIAQVLSNILDFQMPVEEAVTSPRIHWNDGVLNLEPGLQADLEILRAGDDVVEAWQKQNMFFGGVHTLTRSPNNEFFGAGDDRRNGCWGEA